MKRQAAVLKQGIALMALVLAPAARGAELAQSAEPSANSAASADHGEIIVTARKKSERLVDTPISITAFSGEDLTRAGVSDFNEIALRTPGLAYGNFGDEKLSPTSLRGIVGGGDSAGTDPAVGIYVDEVFIGQGAGASIDYFDFDRVEVLRGPQGTLFGRNTIGGVVNISTAPPTRDFHARLEAGAGNYHQLRLGGAVGGPIAGNAVLGRAAFVVDRRGGVDDNVILDRRVNSDKSWSARGQLQFNISDNVTWRIGGDYRRVNQDSLVFETLRYDEDSTFFAVLGLVGAPLNLDAFDHEVQADIVTKEKSKSGGLSSHLTVELEAIQLVNVTAWRKHDYSNVSDTDRSALNWLYDGDPEQGTRWSDELRVSGTTGPVEWLAGGYFYHQNTRNLSFIRIGSDLATILGDPSLAGIEAGSDGSLRARSVALFASATVKVAPQFDITVGGRQTWERKSIDYVQLDPLMLLGGEFSIEAHDNWAKFTPSINARYHFGPDSIAYVTVSQGFKSGGFNDALGDADGISFDPETVWNYEAGVKFSLLNRRLFASAAAYYMKWDNIQLAVDNPDTPNFDPIIINAGKAHSKGIEVELLARALKGLDLRANGTLLEAKYDEGVLPDGTALNHIAFSPKFTLNLGGEYRFQLAKGLSMFLGGDYLVRGRSFLTGDNQDDGRVGTYGLLNLRAGIAGENDRWRLTIWGKNVTDKQAKQWLFDLTGQDLIGQKFVALNEPATFGLSLSAGF